MHRRTGNTRAFTLIELLVVIAIIALLAAILFPVFARARENARRASCQSNMKQIGLGIMQYSQDYDEHLPCGGYTGDTITSNYRGLGMGWAGQANPYIKSIGVLQCPSDATKVSQYNAAAERISYAYNVNISLTKDSWPWDTPGIGGAVAQLNAPAKTVMLSECAGTWGLLSSSSDGFYNGVNGYYYSGSSNGIGGPRSFMIGGSWSSSGTMETGVKLGGRANSASTFPNNGRHLDGANYLMADGHVKWLPATKVSSGVTATSATDPQDTGTNTAEGTSGNTYAVTFSPV